ncbi:MAG: flagellar basal body rod protein FlgB [Clostridiales bacterium]|nr:flagellar basal body rod protein FlgB [Clostridiales bacterium]
MFGKLFSKTQFLEKALDAAWLRNKVISHNIANADTPGYKKYQVSFEDELKAAMASSIKGKKTRSKHMDIGAGSINDVTPRIERSDFTKMRVDENNVDMDVEMANLAKNTIIYNALVQKISGEFQRIKNVINEGRR